MAKLCAFPKTTISIYILKSAESFFKVRGVFLASVIRKSNSFFRRLFRGYVLNGTWALLFPVLLLSSSSWLRFIGCESWVIDGNYPPINLGWLCFLMFVSGALLITLVTYTNFKNKVGISNYSVFLVLFPLLCSPPSTTNDLQIYLYQGHFVHQQLDPYGEISHLEREKNPYYTNVAEQYREIKSKYGPFWIGISAIASELKMPWNMVVFKAINFLILCILVYFLNRNKSEYVWLWLSTIPLVEFVGQGHNDLLSIATGFLLLGAKSSKSGVFNGIAALMIPFTKLLYFPIMAINLAKLIRVNRTGFYISFAIQMAGIGVWYFWHKGSLISSLLTGTVMRPSGSWADIFYEICKAVMQREVPFGRISLIFEILGLVWFFLFIAIIIRSKRITIEAFESVVVFGTLVYFSVFIPRLFPWYFLFLALIFNKFSAKQQGLFYCLSFVGVCQGAVHFFDPEESIIPTITIMLTTFFSLLLLLSISMIEFRKYLR